MGAYENPSMIVDKSGQIISQGFVSAAQSIAKGIDVYAQRYNKQLEEERKRAEQLKVQKSRANLAAGKAYSDFMNDVNSFKIAKPTSVTEDFMKNIYLPKSVELGNKYYDLGKIAFNPNSSEEDIKAATKGMLDLEAQLKGLQNKTANGELIKDTALDIVNNIEKYDFLKFDDKTPQQSDLIVRAVSQDQNQGYVDNKTGYRVKIDDLNNQVYTFYDRDSGNELFTQSINSDSANFLNNFAVKAYDIDEKLATYNKDTNIVDEKNQLNNKYRGENKTVRVGNQEQERTYYNKTDIFNAYAPFIEQTVKGLNALDAEDQNNQSKIVEGFLRRQGFDDKQIEDIYKDKVITQDEIEAAVQKKVLNNLTQNKYNLDSEGNIYTIDKSTKIPKTTATEKKLSAQIKTYEDIRDLVNKPQLTQVDLIKAYNDSPKYAGKPLKTGRELMVELIKSEGNEPTPDLIQQKANENDIELTKIYGEKGNYKNAIEFDLENTDQTAAGLYDAYGLGADELGRVKQALGVPTITTSISAQDLIKKYSN